MSWALVALLAWIVGYPLLLTLFESFDLFGSPTVAHFGEFVSRSDEWTALFRTAWISLASVVISALIGVPLALIFERFDFPGRGLLGALIALPVALPPLVGVIAFIFLYGESGIAGRLLRAGGVDVRWSFGGPVAILIVHGYSMYVYFYVFVRAALARLDASRLEAAASLGAGPVRTFFQVVLPQLRPALSAAALLVFMTSLASFSAPYIFGGGYRVMTTQIVVSKVALDNDMAEVETVVLALLAFVGLLALRNLDSREELASGGRGAAVPLRVIDGRFQRVAAAMAGWLLAAFLLLPHATLLLLSFVPPHTWTTQTLPPILGLGNYASVVASSEGWRPFVNSFWMATTASVAALVLGLLAARLADSGRLRRFLLEGLVVLPWAIPGTVFAVALATAMSDHRPLLLRFLLVGTPWLLPIAYLVRTLPITGRAAFAGFRQFDRSQEEAARSLGAGPLRTLLRVVLPALRPALLAAFALAWITLLGDFVTSVVLYTFDNRPISMEILSSLRAQEMGVAAVYGVLLMLGSAAIFMVWGRRSSL